MRLFNRKPSQIAFFYRFLLAFLSFRKQSFLVVSAKNINIFIFKDNNFYINYNNENNYKKVPAQDGTKHESV